MFENHSSIFPELINIKGGMFKVVRNNPNEIQYLQEVFIPDYYIGKYTVTNAQFAIFLNETKQTEIILENGDKHEFVGVHQQNLKKKNGDFIATVGFENHPITQISWYGALEYVRWLSVKKKKKFNLPTDYQWSFAANGGYKNLNLLFAGSNKLKEVGWYDTNSYGTTQQVGLKFPNQFGVFDMSGNVWEWCLDLYENDDKVLSKDQKLSVLNKNPELRIIRGGSWGNSINQSGLSNKIALNFDALSPQVGFRVISK